MAEKLSFDRIDLRILSLLQEDASLSLAEVAERVGLSTTPCWRRVQALQEAGVIRKRVALLDPEKVGAGVTVFVMVRTSRHDPEWLQRFAGGAAAIPEVVELYRMSGVTDYLLKVQIPSIAAYDAVYKRLIAVAELADVSSAFAMEQIKYTTAVPLGYAGGG